MNARCPMFFKCSLSFTFLSSANLEYRLVNSVGSKHVSPFFCAMLLPFALSACLRSVDWSTPQLILHLSNTSSSIAISYQPCWPGSSTSSSVSPARPSSVVASSLHSQPTSTRPHAAVSVGATGANSILPFVSFPATMSLGRIALKHGQRVQSATCARFVELSCSENHSVRLSRRGP